MYLAEAILNSFKFCKAFHYKVKVELAEIYITDSSNFYSSVLSGKDYKLMFILLCRGGGI